MPVAGLLSAVLQMQLSVPGTGSRWTVLLWTKLLPGAQPSPLPYTTKNPIQQGPSPHSKALPSGGCGYLSTERITTSAPAQTSERLQSQSPPHTVTPKPNILEAVLCFSRCLCLDPARVAGVGASPQSNSSCRRPFAVLQFLLLKH